jgi:hypothetical protein
MAPAHPKPLRLEYDEAIAMAIRDMEDDSVPSIAEAARKHNVAYTTLRDHLKGNGSQVSRDVKGLKQSKGQGKGLLLHINRMDDSGFCLRPEMIGVCTNYILSRIHSDLDKPPVAQW